MRLLKPVELLIVVVTMVLFGCLLVRSQQATDVPLYLEPNQPIERRVNDLLGRMTLKEKVGQLNLPCVYVDDLGKDIPSKMAACRRFAAGTYTNEIGPGSGFFTLGDTILREGPLQQATYFNELQKIALTQTRLKIPLLEDEEGTHGAMLSGATVFPEGLAIGSSFDPALTKAVYSAAAREARALGIHMLSTLVMELDRDPRMGRDAEAYTEDPYLYSRLAESIVQGTQGQDVSAPDKVEAVLTDFPTQSEPVSGLERGAIELSERMLREDFLPPWKAGITESGALGVMAGYPEIEDEPAHGSHKWMTEVLRQELGFQGLVESEGDGFATLIDEGIVATQKEAGALALRAGVDLNITYEPAYMGPLIENVNEGRVPESLVDLSVRRVLREKFRLGLFEHPYVDPQQAVKVVHAQAHQDLALTAAHEGVVLLRNEQNLLPLKKDLKSIAVIGPDADNALNQLGDYTAHTVTQPVVTILQGIKAKVSPQTRVLYARGSEVLGADKSGFAAAVQAAKAADLAVVVVGEQFTHDAATDGEGSDVASLDLTGVQGGSGAGRGGDRQAGGSGLDQRAAALDPLGGRAHSRFGGSVGAGRTRRYRRRGCALWRLQSQRSFADYNSPQCCATAGLLRLQAFQGLLGTERLEQESWLRRYAFQSSLSLRLRFELHTISVRWPGSGYAANSPWGACASPF